MSRTLISMLGHKIGDVVDVVTEHSVHWTEKDKHKGCVFLLCV